jgi:hypothetical protein
VGSCFHELKCSMDGVVLGPCEVGWGLSMQGCSSLVPVFDGWVCFHQQQRRQFVVVVSGCRGVVVSGCRGVVVSGCRGVTLSWCCRGVSLTLCHRVVPPGHPDAVAAAPCSLGASGPAC